MKHTLKIYGPPGTGKTHTLLEYFHQELQASKPSRVGFVTFTRAARHEALSRVSMTEEELPHVRTLHATCYRALNMSQDQLVMRKDLLEFGRTIGVQLSGMMPDLFSLESAAESWRTPTKADYLLQLNHLGRHRGLKFKDTMKSAPMELDYKYAMWFTKAYRGWKTAMCKRDYTDLLTDFIEMGDAPDLDVLFIDEAQDLSWLQWEVARKLSANCKRVYICGDDDQTIFRWAGASASVFNLEPADDVRVLEQSYRLPRAVFEASQRIIHRVKVRQEKSFKPRDAEGEFRAVGHLDVPMLKDESVLVLYRNYHRGTALSLQLEELGVPFTGTNSALTKDEVKAALTVWGRAAQGETEEMQLPAARSLVMFAHPAFLNVNYKQILEPRQGTVKITDLFKEGAFVKPWHQILPKFPRLPYLIRAVAKYGWKELLNPRIQLMSIHQAKGRQAETVILDLEMARKTHEAYMREPDDEHRVMYVGMTRAKQRLLTLLPTDAMHYQL